MKKKLLIGVLLAGLTVGLVGGLREMDTAIQATELDFSKLLSMIEPAVVKITNIFECEVNGTFGISPRGGGSGFIISEDGDVVTDWHVIEEAVVAEKYKGAETDCYLAVDGKIVKKKGVYTGKVVIGIEVPQEKNPQEFREKLYLATKINKANSLHDLALLETNITNPTRVWCGDSSTVRKGDGGFVIGYPDPNNELTVTEHQISNHYQKEDMTVVIVVDGIVFQLIPMHPPQEKDGKLVWHHAMLPAPLDFTLIPVNVEYDLEQNKFTKCEAKVEAEEVKCGVVKEVRDYLQTDDAIDTGNSGGPIFNWNGQVIGIAVSMTKISKVVKVDEEMYASLLWTAEYHTTINKAKEILGICR